jgi:hypothetical protein
LLLILCAVLDLSIRRVLSGGRRVSSYPILPRREGGNLPADEQYGVTYWAMSSASGLTMDFR